MNYKFDKDIIHQEKPMWDLALSYICHYDFIKKEVANAKENISIMYKGNLVMEWDKDYKKILSDYKKELEFMNKMLEFNLKQKNSVLAEYIENEK